MYVYDFVSTRITEPQVRSIINTAGYTATDYRYTPRASHDGYVVQDGPVMNVNRLENAAKKLKLDNGLEIFSPNNLMLAADAPASDYQVTITMSDTTANALSLAGFFLYGFKAVQSTNNSGLPLVWFKTQTYSTNTVITWAEQYEGYTSTSTLIPNGEIVATFSAPMALGQTLLVNQPTGTGEVDNGGVPTAISIQSAVQKQFTCGISQTPSGSTTPSPMCAFPLYGDTLDVIAPIEKVLLMFSTNPVNTGVVIEQSFSAGLLIDLTSSNQRQVSYDINTGWSWDGGAWGQPIAASTHLAPLLVDAPAPPARNFQRRALVLA